MNKSFIVLMIMILLSACGARQAALPEPFFPQLPYTQQESLQSSHRQPQDSQGVRDFYRIQLIILEESEQLIFVLAGDKPSLGDLPSWEIFYHQEDSQLILNLFSPGPSFPALFTLQSSQLVESWQVERRYRLGQGEKRWYRELTLNLTKPVLYRLAWNERDGLLLELKPQN